MVSQESWPHVLYQRLGEKKRVVLALLLLAVALFTRTYNLYERTEFLGDQGSTATVLYESFRNRTIPLAGPAVSTGFRPGPFFYYLVFPVFILFGFNPLGMVVPMVLFGAGTVFILWYLGQRLFGFWPGFFTALLYAASPIISSQNIAIWNPAPIPFFVGLILLSFFNIYTKKRYGFFALIGFSSAGLIQLHFSNVITIFVVILFGIFILIRNIHGRYAKIIVLWQIIGALCFLLTLSPYIVYEVKHDFEDFKNLLLFFLLPNKTPDALTSDYRVGFDLGLELFRRVIPLTSQIAMQAVAAALLVTSIFWGGFWGRLFAFWFMGAMVPILWYKGPIFEHYVYFLSVIPFLLFGFFLKRAFSRRYGLILGLTIGVIVWYQYKDINKAFPSVNDLQRTRSVVDEMNEHAGDRDFSFTLLSSRSFSDYHYRYFFRLRDRKPRFIYDEDYRVLFLVCDKAPCPSGFDMEKQNAVPVLCYELQCKTSYPDKRLGGWKLDAVVDIPGARLFTFFQQ